MYNSRGNKILSVDELEMLQKAEDKAIKHDGNKPDYSLMPSTPMDEVAKVWTFGQKKYDAFNWTKGFGWRRPVAASLRHIFAWLRGESYDKESGLHHLAHAICGLMMVIHFEKHGTGTDDRYKEENETR